MRAPFLYLDYMDYGHYDTEDVSRAKMAASGSWKAKWHYFEKRLAKEFDELSDNF